MAALWMTAEDVKDDFKKFAVDNSTDWAKASWYQEIPYAEVAECAEILYKEKFPLLQTHPYQTSLYYGCFMDDGRRCKG